MTNSLFSFFWLNSEMSFAKIYLLLLILSALSVTACGHQPVRTASMPTSYYQVQAQKGVEAVTMPGYVSRYQRQTIITGNSDYSTSECAKSFDGVMDHLETLMAPQIAENNRIAAAQATDPAYKF